MGKCGLLDGIGIVANEEEEGMKFSRMPKYVSKFRNVEIELGVKFAPHWKFGRS